MPAATVRSPTGAPSLIDARASSAARAVAQARRSSPPPCAMVRLAPVIHWSGVVAVSPITISMRSKATSSSSAAICASAVLVPVPRSTLPTNMVTFPSGPSTTNESTTSLATDLAGRSAAPAACASVASTLKPTTSAPAPALSRLRRLMRVSTMVVVFIIFSFTRWLRV